MDVEQYLARHPVPSRPSDKQVRTYVQGAIQWAQPGGLAFSQGAAEYLARLVTDAVMQRPSLATRRAELVLALRNLEALATCLKATDVDELPEGARQALAKGRIDAQAIKALGALQVFASVRPYGLLAATSFRPPVGAPANDRAANDPAPTVGDEEATSPSEPG